jgi:hypothetical protein
MTTIRLYSLAVILMGIVPILTETFFLSTLTRIVFHIPMNWSFVLAFGVSSISPGVVVPLLLNLIDRPGWHGSRLPPLLLASTVIKFVCY